MRCLEFAQGKTLSRGFLDEYSFKQLCRKTRGQWQKCYGEVSMSIYYYEIIICTHYHFAFETDYHQNIENSMVNAHDNF